MNLNQKPQCLLCGGSNLHFVRQYRTDSDHGADLFGGSALHMCNDCSFVQVVPVPSLEQLASYYATDYRANGRYGARVANVANFPKDNLFYLNRGGSIVALLAPYIDKIPRRKPLRVLDIGTGFGHILHAFGERFPGCERYAIEISEPCIRHLRNLGIKVFPKPVQEVLPVLRQEFDVITMSHLLEHIHSPVDMLRRVSDKLAPNGLLYVEVPNIPVESLNQFPDNKWAPRVDEPHITFFATKSLMAMLEKIGMQVLFAETAGAEYKNISRLRFSLPRFQPLLLDLMPEWLFTFLRKQRLTKPVRVQEREDTFYQYGGNRIWIRSISCHVGN